MKKREKSELILCFGANLKFLRKKHCLSQEDLAEALSVSRGSISYYELGDRTADIEFLVKVKEHFKILLDDLLLGRLEPSKAYSTVYAIEQDMLYKNTAIATGLAKRGGQDCPNNIKNTEKQIDGLYRKLEDELRNRPPVYSLRTISAMDRQRQGLALTNNRFFITVLERHILGATQSVVFFFEITEDYYLLQMCCPLKEAQRRELAASGYVPRLSSKLMLSVGLESEPPYAYSSIRLSPYSSVIDLFDGLFVLKRELEKYLTH